MDSMNNICKNKSALALQRSRDQSAADQDSESELTTAMKTTITDAILNVFSTMGTDSPYNTNSTSAIPTDKLLNFTTPEDADTDLYIDDEDVSVDATFAEQLTSTPATLSVSSAGIL